MHDTAQEPSQVASPRAGYALLLGIVVFGGLSLILARLAQDEGMPTPVIVFTRLSIGAAILSAIVMQRGGSWPALSTLRPRHAILIVFAGVFQAIHFLSGYYALEYTTVTVTSLVLLTAPVWVLICEITFLNMVPSLSMRYGLVISLLGGVLVASGSFGGGFGSQPVVGALLALGAALGIAFYMFIGRIVRPHLDNLTYIWAVYSVSALSVLIVVIVQRIPVTGYTSGAYAWALILTLIAQVYAQSAINYVLGIFSATFVSIVLRAVNVMATFYAAIFFSEIPAPLQIVGGAMILAGVIITTRRPSLSN